MDPTRIRVGSRPARSEADCALYIGATAFAFGLFLFLLAAIPAGAKSLSGDTFHDVRRVHRVLLQPLELSKDTIPQLMLKERGPALPPGRAHAGESGKMGSPKTRSKDGLFGMKGPRDNGDPHMAKLRAAEAAKQAGVLGIFRSNEASAVTSVFGRDTALGRDAMNALGGLVGHEMREAYGLPSGLGLVGDKDGGGGTGPGTLGPGPLGTIGKGVSGTCDMCGPHYWRQGAYLSRARHRADVPEPVAGQVKMRGKLDKEIIRRVIRSHIQEVKFCYESELVRRPDLYGRVTVQFTITPQGSVASSAIESSTLHDSQVEKCIAQSVRRWTFPKPEDGGVVLVTYPFVLHAATAR